MTDKTIYAHTPNTHPYPPFLNVSETPEGFVITVRSPAGPGPFSDKDCGQTAAIVIGLGELTELSDALVKRLDEVE